MNQNFRKKILMVVGSNKLNGTERYAVDIAKKLPKEKFDVWVAIPETGYLSEVLIENEIKEFNYKNGISDKFTLKGSWELFKFIRKNKINIVHANSGVIPCIIAKLLTVGLILETKHGLFFTEEELKKLSLRKKIHEKMKQYFVDYFIAISHNDKERMIKYFQITENKIIVIYNGVDIDRLSEYRKKKQEIGILNNSDLKFGNIGRLTYQKAQEKLIHAVSNFKSLKENFKILIIGNGEDRQMLQDLIMDKGLTDRISLINYSKDIYQYYLKLDGLILTSRYEGIPYVMMEAMVLGIPVITTDVGGIGNIIKNGINGIIIDANKNDEIENAMLKFYREKEFINSLTINAYNTIKEYSINLSINNYMKLYLNH